MFPAIRRKECFTLIELLIVLFIISLGVILTGIKVKGLYDEQRFFSEAQQVLGHLAMAQDLMLIMDTDVDVKLSRDPDSRGIRVQLDVERPFDLEKSFEKHSARFEEHWARFVERKLSLSSIRSFSFDRNRENSLSLRFSLGGLSKGTLTLYEGNSNSGDRQFSIELAGYPRPLKGISKEEDTKQMLVRDPAEKGKTLYPDEVHKELYENPNKKKEAI
jgi:hypothetical protein